MKLSSDWAELKARVKWLHTAFGLGQMVCEWEGQDGVVRKVKAITVVELLSKVRAEIDSSEIEPPRSEPATAISAISTWSRSQSEPIPQEYLEAAAEANKAFFGKMLEPKPKAPVKPKKPEPPKPYQRKFG